MAPLAFDDEHAPLYTVGQVAGMLDVQPAFLRRLDVEQVVQPARSDGGQRRYSRNDIELLGAALILINQGIPRAAVAAILERDLTIQRLTLEP